MTDLLSGSKGRPAFASCREVRRRVRAARLIFGLFDFGGDVRLLAEGAVSLALKPPNENRSEARFKGSGSFATGVHSNIALPRQCFVRER